MTRSIRLFALVTLLIVAACGGGSDPGTDPGALDVGSDPGPADVIADFDRPSVEEIPCPRPLLNFHRAP